MRRLVLVASIVGVLGCEGGLDALVAGDGGGPGPGSGDGGATCPAGAFCDDFEGDLAPNWTIENDGARGQVGTVDGQGRGGTRALRVATPMSGVSGASVQHPLDGVRASGLVAVRAWVTLVPGSPKPANASLVEIRRAGRVPGGISLKLFGDELSYDVTDAAGASHAPSPTMAPGIGAGPFVCLRLYVDVGAAGRVRILRGDDTVVDQPVDTLVGFAGWEAVSIGLPFVGDTPGAAALVDDVVIADHPVDCE